MERLKKSALNVVIYGSVNRRLLFFRLKTIKLVLKNTQEAELLVKRYETKLCEEEAVTADKNNIENLMGTLKVRVGWYLFMGKLKKDRKTICLKTPVLVKLYLYQKLAYVFGRKSQKKMRALEYQELSSLHVHSCCLEMLRSI